MDSIIWCHRQIYSKKTRKVQQGNGTRFSVRSYREVCTTLDTQLIPFCIFFILNKHIMTVTGIWHPGIDASQTEANHRLHMGRWLVSIKNASFVPWCMFCQWRDVSQKIIRILATYQYFFVIRVDIHKTTCR